MIEDYQDNDYISFQKFFNNNNIIFTLYSNISINNEPPETINHIGVNGTWFCFDKTGDVTGTVSKKKGFERKV